MRTLLTERLLQRVMPGVMRGVIAAVAFCVWWMMPAAAAAQGITRLELGGNYDYVRTNAPPGGCGCFSAQGGDAWAGWRWSPELSLVAQAGVQTATNISGTPTNLTLVTLLGGPRLALPTRRRLVPFGEVMLGGAHAAGGVTPSASGSPGSSNVFAMMAGGGADLVLNRLLLVRLADVDYFYTRFANGTNDHQNNLRVAAGIVVQFGRR